MICQQGYLRTFTRAFYPLEGDKDRQCFLLKLLFLIKSEKYRGDSNQCDKNAYYWTTDKLPIILEKGGDEQGKSWEFGLLSLSLYNR
jgi:hypothetical protein